MYRRNTIKSITPLGNVKQRHNINMYGIYYKIQKGNKENKNVSLQWTKALQFKSLNKNHDGGNHIFSLLMLKKRVYSIKKFQRHENVLQW